MCKAFIIMNRKHAMIENKAIDNRELRTMKVYLLNVN